MEPPKDEKIRVFVKTVDGDYNEFEWGQDHTADQATEMAMEHFGIEPPDDAKYRVAVKTEEREFRTLERDKSLLEQGIRDGDTLWLGTEQAVG